MNLDKKNAVTFHSAKPFCQSNPTSHDTSKERDLTLKSV